MLLLNWRLYLSLNKCKLQTIPLFSHVVLQVKHTYTNGSLWDFDFRWGCPKGVVKKIHAPPMSPK